MSAAHPGWDLLAAQRGTERPKSLLEIGRRHLVDHQLEMFAEAGVAPVGMVVGYCADEIRETVGIRAEYIENPRWSTTNSLYSFWLSRQWVKGPVVVVNSDTVVHPDILNRLLDAEGDAFAYDSSSGDAQEHMKVRVVDGRLAEMSKTLSAESASGENVGILKFTEATAQALFAAAGTLVEVDPKQWLGAAVSKVAQQHALDAIDVADLPWGEIDSPYDLDRVRKHIVPQIQRTAWRRKRPWRLGRWALLAAAVLGVGYLGAGRWLGPPEIAWETLDVAGARKVRITTGERTQKWWLLKTGDVARAPVNGPTVLRIDTRSVLPRGAAKSAPYVLEVKLDGELVDWFKRNDQSSTTWKHADWQVGRRRRIILDIPAGAHQIEASLVAAVSGRCLVRLRQSASPDDDVDETDYRGSR